MIIAYDLGTGGLKASLYGGDGILRDFVFEKYPTFFSGANIAEQRPADWIDAVALATRALFEKSSVAPESVEAVAFSGHSLGVVPVSRDGKLLAEKTPIWSDKRASEQARRLFEKFDYKKWYCATGGGFPPECYSLFKIMWYRDNAPEMFAEASVFLGTKDYCNFALTGEIATDRSYASGCGAFDLLRNRYDAEILEAAGLPESVFAPILPSAAVVGTVSESASRTTGLAAGTKVVCGGVDNACMALGSMGTEDGRIYTSLGSSAWVALSSKKLVLDFELKPYVFAHLIDGMFVSSTCIFSAGTSLEWLRRTMCPELDYRGIDALAAESPVGANGAVFNPSLAGGSMIEKSPDITGFLSGLKLSTTRSDILRAALEGVALNLNFARLALCKTGVRTDSMLLTGGGAKSSLWRRIFADVYAMRVRTSSVNQDAASLGAAALAMKTLGMIRSYSEIDGLHVLDEPLPPNSENAEKYAEIYGRFRALAEAEIVF